MKFEAKAEHLQLNHGTESSHQEYAEFPFSLKQIDEATTNSHALQTLVVLSLQ